MGGGTDTQSTKYDPPEWVAGRMPGAMDAADQLASQPFPMFAGQTRAEINPWQHTAGQLTVDRALNGDPQMNAGRGSLMSISQGGAQNPYMDSNPYANNAYTDRMIQDNAQNMTDAYLGGSAMNMDALAARQGAFGGSAHTAAQQAGAQGLAKQVGQMATGTRQQDLARQGGLWGQDAARQSQNWQNDVGNVMQASGMSLPFSQNDQSSYDALMNAGNFQQQYQQGLLSDQQQNFQDQTAYPFKMLDYALSAYARGSGGFGQQFQTQPGQSGVANGLGGLLAAYGMTQ